VKIGEILGSNFVYQTESTILRVAARTPVVEDAFLRARRQVRQWLERVCGRYDLALAPAGDSAAANDRCSIDLIVRPNRLVAALRHGDDRFPERTWHVNVDLRSAQAQDVAVCDLRLRAEHPSNARPIEPHPARVIGLLTADPGLQDVEPMRSGPAVVRLADVTPLTALIDAPERRFPVILASRPLALDLNAIALELAGLAHVFELEDAASWEISRRYDKRYSAYLGAVRIYPPGVTFASDPKASPLFLAQTLQTFARDRKAESAVRRGILADLTAEFESEPLLTPAALRAQEAAAERRLAPELAAPEEAPPAEEPVQAAELELQHARQEAAAARREAEGYWREILELNTRVEDLEKELAQLRQTELGISVEELSPPQRELLRTIFSSVTQVRDALLDNDRLRSDLDDLQLEYEGLRARLARLYEPDRRSVLPAEPIPRPEWNDFDGLTTWAQEQYAGALVFHPRVRDRLHDGNPQDVDALFDILDILGTDYVAMKRGQPGARERYVERTKRYKNGKALTKVGAGLVGDDYACSYDGVDYAADEIFHLRERGKDFTGRTVCVYFVYDAANGRVIVTSMPRHLATANSYT
jgi:hypothetical protein